MLNDCKHILYQFLREYIFRFLGALSIHSQTFKSSATDLRETTQTKNRVLIGCIACVVVVVLTAVTLIVLRKYI